ncbi:hypothetical protein SPI_00311 [Niveomyces insectorum RCEF 264]|uniref:Uncharacterized protein n=1 Tax=Niveomyces insectorum RCEF 264 TaxID=1081102 RepID=A0A168A109_9HYPO|nr:hypothetical protein SPI_00311 [Niveomyces insectorum RCEF 264]
MSDTSDYTIVSPSPEMDTTSSRTVMDQAADEIEDVIHVIRYSLTTTYETGKAVELSYLQSEDHADGLSDADGSRYSHNEDAAKQCGLCDAKECLAVLTAFQKALAALHDDNHTEIVNLLVESISEATATLVNVGEKYKDFSETNAVRAARTEALLIKCEAHVLRRATQSLSCSEPARAALRRTAVRDAFLTALSYVGYEHLHVARQSATTLRKLLSTYARSVTAVPETASALATVYCVYAESVISELDGGGKNTADAGKTTAVGSRNGNAPDSTNIPDAGKTTAMTSGNENAAGQGVSTWCVSSLLPVLRGSNYGGR